MWEVVKRMGRIRAGREERLLTGCETYVKLAKEIVGRQVRQQIRAEGRKKRGVTQLQLEGKVRKSNLSSSGGIVLKSFQRNQQSYRETWKKKD